MPLPEALWDYLNSEISKALIGSLLGAIGGALGAHIIAMRSKQREEKIQEIRNANGAVTMAYAITEHLLTLKDQIVKPLHDKFIEQRAKFEKLRGGPQPADYRPEFDLNTHDFIPPPIQHLEELVYKRVSAPTRPAMVLPILTRTLKGLEVLHASRNKICEEFRIFQARHGGIIGEVYFGTRTEHGADARYSSTLDNISQYTDDAIHFSKLIGDDLRTYAMAVRDTLPNRVKAQAPIIISAEYPKLAHLLPDRKKYEDYDRMFRRIRSLGRGIWTAEFEALAYAQYETEYIMSVT